MTLVRYEQLRGEMAERSQTVQDTAPLVKIKDALKRLKIHEFLPKNIAQ